MTLAMETGGLCQCLVLFITFVVSIRGQGCPADIFETAPRGKTCAVVSWTTPANQDDKNGPQIWNGDCWPEGAWNNWYSLNGVHTCEFRVQVEVIHCYLPRQFLNGQRSCNGAAEDNVWGSVCTHSCNTGYTLRGTASVECTHSRQWTNPLPRCEINRCPLPNILNSRRSCTQSNQYRSVCTYTCDIGHELQGSSSATCRADKTWNTQPACPKIRCPPEPAIANSRRSCTDVNRYRSVCSYTCSIGYQLQGNADVQCRANKTWSSQPTCPEACLWVKHHCWPGDCSGNYASNCVCRPGFTRKPGNTALCDLDTPPELSICHMSVTDASGDMYNPSYPGNDTECGTQKETWIQADPVKIHFRIQADWNLTVGSLVDYVSQSQVGIVGIMVSMVRVNVSGDEVFVQNETLNGTPFCQHNVSSRNPLTNGTSFVCQGTFTLPELNLTGGESLCVDLEANSGGYYSLQDASLAPRGQHLYTNRATLKKRVCFIRDCFDGWYTRRCDKECLNCDVTGSCVRDTGVCDFGCKPGWLVGNSTSFCNTTCPEYTFGKDCKLQCGNCGNSTSCRHDNGTCEKGCANDYGGKLCERWVGRVLTLQIAAGTLFGLSLVVALLLLMLILYRRKFLRTTQEISPEQTPSDTPRSVSDVSCNPESEDIFDFPQSDVGLTPEPEDIFDFPQHSLFVYSPSRNPAPTRPPAAKVKKATTKPTVPRSQSKTKPTPSKGHNHVDNPPLCDFKFRHSSCNRPCCATAVCQTYQCPIHVNHFYNTWFDD